MFNKILFATDISEASDHVIDCSRGLIPFGAKEAVLVHALGIRHLESLKYELARLAEPQLLAQKCKLDNQGYKTKIEIAPGSASLEINRIAIKENTSLIVIGTHGKGFASHALLGGTAADIMHNMIKPLLVIRIEFIEEEGQRCQVFCQDFSKSILYATDFSDTAQRAFTYVEKIVESGCRQVTLMHVQDKTTIEKHLEHRMDEFNQIDQERLEMLKARLIERGAQKVNILLPYGSPISEIIKESKADDYSLIVMGSQGQGFIKEIFLGSVSHNVVRNVMLPVLLIPALR